MFNRADKVIAKIRKKKEEKEEKDVNGEGSNADIEIEGLFEQIKAPMKGKEGELDPSPELEED